MREIQPAGPCVSSPSHSPLNRYRVETFALVTVLAGLLVYSSFWAVLDIAVRLQVWPRGLLPFDAYAFTEVLSPLSVAAFYIWWLTKLVILVLLLLRKSQVLPVAMAGLIANLMDYVLLAPNTQFDASATWMFSFSAEVVLLALLWRRRRSFV